MISLRFAQSEADSELLLKWRNDPFICQHFNNPKPVNRAEHVRWFEGAIMNSNCRLFIIELVTDLHETPRTPLGSKFPIGQIRFDREGVSCEISIGIPEAHTGKGYGTEAIRQGCQRVGKIWPGIDVLARFVPNNCPSKGAFRKAGFVPANETSTTMMWKP